MDQFTLVSIIPEDLLFQILLRLPVSSLLRFRSVCKSWLSHIDSSRFISQHARHTSDNKLVVENYRVDFSTSISISTFTFTFISADDLCREPEYVEFAQNVNNPIWANSLVLSSDGVICLWHTKMVGRAKADIVALWNPATSEMNVLPPALQSDAKEDSCLTNVRYGFGLDVENNDYKVVKIAEKNYLLRNEFKSNVEVYSLSMGHWRAINAVVPPKFYIISNPKKPYRNGIYCWLGTHSESRDYSILSFNFSSEAFGIIPGPEFYTDYNHPILTFLREKIACVYRVFDDSESFSSHYNIWVLDEYGVKESWTKLYTIMLDQVDKPLGFSMDGKLILLKLDRRTLRLYDPRTKEVNDVLTPWDISEVAMYKESLVSVKSANGVTKKVASEENPCAKGLLNVPRGQNEELKIVCGEDQTTWRFARSDADLPSDTLEGTSANQETSEGPLTAKGTSG